MFTHCRGSINRDPLPPIEARFSVTFAPNRIRVYIDTTALGIRPISRRHSGGSIAIIPDTNIPRGQYRAFVERKSMDGLRIAGPSGNKNIKGYINLRPGYLRYSCRLLPSEITQLFYGVNFKFRSNGVQPFFPDRSPRAGGHDRDADRVRGHDTDLRSDCNLIPRNVRPDEGYQQRLDADQDPVLRRRV